MINEGQKWRRGRRCMSVKLVVGVYEPQINLSLTKIGKIWYILIKIKKDFGHNFMLKEIAFQLPTQQRLKSKEATSGD